MPSPCRSTPHPPPTAALTLAELAAGLRASVTPLNSTTFVRANSEVDTG